MSDQITGDTASADIDSSPCLPPQLIPNLPDDISLQILARIPRSRHPFLSLVSKSWRSTISSPELFCTRSLLRSVETSLYLNLRFNSSFHWYSEQNLQSKRTLIPLPSIPENRVGPSISVLGPKIYVIGGSINDIPSNNIWVFDCRFNKWENGPRMRVAREFSAAGTWDGKIYVMGGCIVDSWARSINGAEVFDPKMGSWAAVPSAIEVRDKWMHASAMIGSKLFCDGG